MALVHETLYRSGRPGRHRLLPSTFPCWPKQCSTPTGCVARRSRSGSTWSRWSFPSTSPFRAHDAHQTDLESAKHALVADGRRRAARRLPARGPASEWYVLASAGGSSGNPAGNRRRPQKSSFGLELVGLLTEQLNGSVRKRNEAGFCVSVTFPLAPSAGKEGNRGSSRMRQAFSSSKTKRLVAEDIRISLETHGYTVAESHPAGTRRWRVLRPASPDRF